MKVIYEFTINDPTGEKDEMKLELYKITEDMYLSLIHIRDYLREIEKGWREDSKEAMLERINELIYDSNIYEII